jgi:hypothetical protein
MPDVSQYKFNLPEVTEMLVRKAGLTEGIWQLSVDFSFAAATMGPSEKEAMPTGLVAVSKLGISRVDKATALTIDASKLKSE